MFISIQKILPAVAERIKHRGEIEIYKIRSLWPELMTDFYGERIKDIKISPLYLKNNILTVSCPDSVWAYDLRMKEKIVLEELNKHFNDGFGNKKIKKIKLIYK